MFSLCQSSTCGYNYLRVGGRDGRLYLLDTTGDRFEEITVSLKINYCNRADILQGGLRTVPTNTEVFLCSL